MSNLTEEQIKSIIINGDYTHPSDDVAFLYQSIEDELSNDGVTASRITRRILSIMNGFRLPSGFYLEAKLKRLEITQEPDFKYTVGELALKYDVGVPRIYQILTEEGRPKVDSLRKRAERRAKKDVPND